MYSKEQLIKYPYFEKILQDRDISTVVDSLTGLISRSYIIGFIHNLIDNKIPFTLAMVDLDNFKYINDTQGHKIGDAVLSGFSSDLKRYLSDYGVAGRFGGDEFLIVNFRDFHTMTTNHEFTLKQNVRQNKIKLEIDEIYCIITENNKVIALTDNGKFLLKHRMYQLEEKLPQNFIKINQSCIANINEIKRFDSSISGTLKVVFKNGFSDYVSRRNIKSVKERLGVK